MHAFGSRNSYTIEDMCVKYIHSNAILFLKKNDKFCAAISAILDVKFTVQWKNDGK